MLDPELEMEVDDLARLSTNNGPTETDVVDIYAWIDSLNFSRPKKNITRDFSDGVLMAELIHHYVPKIIDIRNYYQALSKKNKENNWFHLNLKVLSKLGIRIDKPMLNDVMENKPGAIEKILYDIRPFLARRNRTILNYRREGGRSSNNSTAAYTVNTNESQTRATKVVPKKPQRSTSISAAPKRPSFPRAMPKGAPITKPSEKFKDTKPAVVQKQPVAKAPRSLVKQPFTNAPEPLAKRPATKAPEPLAKQQATKAPEPLAKQQATKTPEPLVKQPATNVPEPLAKQPATEAPEPMAKPVAKGQESPKEEESLESILPEALDSDDDGAVVGNNNAGIPGPCPSSFPTGQQQTSSHVLKKETGNIVIGGDFSAKVSPQFMSAMDSILFSEEDLLKSVNSLSWAGVGNRTPTNLLSSAMRMHMSGLV